MNKKFTIIFFLAGIFTIFSPIIFSNFGISHNSSSAVFANESLDPEDGSGGSPADPDAVPDPNGGGSGGSVPNLNPDDITAPDLNPAISGSDKWDWPSIVKQFISWLLIVAGVVTAVSIIIAGYIYMSSGGDPEKAKIGKNAIIGAVIGLVIIFIVYALINFTFTILFSTNNGTNSQPSGNEENTEPTPISCLATCPENSNQCICGEFDVICMKDYVEPGQTCGGVATEKCETNNDCSEGLSCTEVPTSDYRWCTDW